MHAVARPRPETPVDRAGRLDLEVVVPVRWDGPVDPATEEALLRSLRTMAAVCDVTLVDGSRGAEADVRRRRWEREVRVITPDPVWGGPNGKVTGAMTGVAAARHDRVVVSDDDVRHDRRTLEALAVALDTADLVVPQNHPTSWPWWAWWEGGRSLLNRALATDWPGTAAIRRDVAVGMGGWAADVFFENLQMARTVRAAGGRVVHRPDVLVPRDPPTLRHFLRQRVRQAYEDQAQPVRLLVGLSVVPAVVALRHRPTALTGAAAGIVAVAELGRRRAGGTAAFPWFVPLAAPAWLLERGVCTWLAVLARLRGGLRYNGARMSVAARRVPRRPTR